MSRHVPDDRPLTDVDREYLEGRGVFGSLIQRIDACFPPGGTDNYEKMTREELLTELEKRKLAKTGGKEEVIARLRKDDEK